MSPLTFVINMKTLIKCLLLLLQLIAVIHCQRASKDDDFSYRREPASRHQEYDKKMLETLLKEVISDELNKMKSGFDQPKELPEPKREKKEKTEDRRAPASPKEEIDPVSQLMEEKLRLEKLRRKLEQEVARRERIREERDREERLREEKTRRELKRLEKLLAEAKSKIKATSYSEPETKEREVDPLKLFNLKELDMLTDEAKITESGDNWMNPDVIKDYMDLSQQGFDFSMIPSNDRPQFLQPEPKPSPPPPQFAPAPSPSQFMPNFDRPFNTPHNFHPSFNSRPRPNPMHFGGRQAYPPFNPSMNRFPSPHPPMMPPSPPRSMPLRIGNGQSLTSLASSMYPSVYGHMKKSRSEEKEEKRPSKKIKSAIKDFAVSSIIDVGMMSLMNNLLGKINAEPGTGRRFYFS